jgi:hypothetical protein
LEAIPHQHSPWRRAKTSAHSHQAPLKGQVESQRAGFARSRTFLTLAGGVAQSRRQKILEGMCRRCRWERLSEVRTFLGDCPGLTSWCNTIATLYGYEVRLIKKQPESWKNLMNNLVKKLPCVTRRIADETLLIPIRGQAADLDAIYVLNDTAAFLWSQLDTTGDVAALGAVLCEAFEVSPEQAAQDVAEFLAALEESGIVEFRHAASSAA